MKCSVEILETNNEALDEKPSDIAAGEKVIGGGALLTREVQADRKDHQEIHPDDDQIDRGESPMGDGSQCVH